ncbi:MAG TPA: hypothetical protein DEB12_11040 [Porphyromonadaceae bacterium]|nr:hypothetical protein [Porphyromonadaceae bacterium]
MHICCLEKGRRERDEIMKILMHTMHMSTSIGASLQACALGKKLLSIGHSPYLLYYVPPFYSDVLSSNVHCSSFRDVFSYIINGGNREKERLRFVDFKNKCHSPLTNKYTGIDSLLSDVPAFDAYICGSDQVWNPMITHYDMSYFFTFVNNGAKKISYAASIGRDVVSLDIEEYLSTGLSHMDYIGVREDTAVSAIKKILPDMDITQNIDPTFLLDKEEWRTMYSQPQSNLPKRYILYYPIKETELGISLLAEMKRKYALPCVSFSSSFRKAEGVDLNLHGIGPAEFLYLCNNAEMVLTNSFHGFALSVIHKKKVICFTKPHQNTRMESLSRLLNLQDLMISSVGEVKSKKWDNVWSSCYKSIAARIKQEQNRADAYLRKALG